MNHSIIQFIMGPMVWVSFGIFIFGLIFKTIALIWQVKQKESFIFNYLTFRHSLRSILAWLVPFLPQSTRTNPLFYGLSYIFHICLFVVPLFLMSHIVLINESFQISWAALDNTVADLLTLVIIIALLGFVVRRAHLPHVRDLTSFKDFLLIFFVALPFITGFLAYHQFFAYQWMVVLHVVSGEILLIMIPFTRFTHMVTGPFSRAYTGSEFGNVRHAKDW